jgi:nucleotide-binding universal stress UspA family protein
VLGIACQLGLALFMFTYSSLAWYVALGWLAVGWGIWIFYAKPREHEAKATPVVISQHVPTKKEHSRILVPVANPASAEGLMAFAARQARIEDSEVIALHTVILPPQVPPSAGRGLIRRARPLIDQATEHLERLGARASSLVRVSHTRAWRAILDTVQEYDVDMVVMGWRGHSRDPSTIVGRNIDKVLKGADCDVVVLQNPRAKPYGKVLVAVANPARGGLMLRVARLLAEHDGAIDILHVTNPARGVGDGAVEKLESVAKEARDADPTGPPIRVIEVAAIDPVREIVNRSREYGTLVIGSTEESWYRQRMFATATHRIATRTRCPLALVGPGAGGLKHGVQTFFEFFRDLEKQAAEEEAEVRATPEPEKPPEAPDQQEHS